MSFFRLCLCVFLFGPFAAGHAQLRIEISRGVEKAVPVAVVPFASASGLAVDVAQVVASDLERSGRFELLPRAQMVSRPTTGREVDFDDWRLLDVEIVVVGQIMGSPPGELTIQFQIFDVFRGKQLLGYRQPAGRNNLRAAAHRVADLVYEELTGIRGIFSTRIAYVTVTGEREDRLYRLIVADADGEGARVIVESGEPIMSPAWSPDGRKLAYVSFENGNSEVYVQTLRSGARQRVSARAGVNSAPAWAPDGRRLALTLSKETGNLDVYTLDLGTQLLTRLTERGSIDTEPAWSADGREVFFTSDRGGGPQVYRVPAGGGTPARVTFEGAYNARPRLSPDGRQLAVVHNDRGNYRIAVVDVERGFTQVLSDGRLDESPSFAPNGETLIYATRAGRRGVLATVSADGRIRQRISAVDGDVREPVWSPYPLN